MQNEISEGQQIEFRPRKARRCSSGSDDTARFSIVGSGLGDGQLEALCSTISLINGEFLGLRESSAFLNG